MHKKSLKNSKIGKRWQKFHKPAKVLFFMIVFAALGGGYYLYTSNASPANAPNKSQNKQIDVKLEDQAKVMRSNTQILAIGEAVYKSSGRSGRAGAPLTFYAKERKDALLRLFASDPAVAAQLLTPDTTLSSLSNVNHDKNLEKKMQLSGTYSMMHRHQPDNVSIDTHQIVTSDGTFTLYSNGKFPSLRGGTTVSLTGYQLGQSVFIPTADDETTVPIVNTNKVLAAASYIGDIKAAVIFGDFTDSTASLDVNATKASFQGNPGKDVSSYFSEASYGKSSLSASFFGPYRLSATTNEACGSADLSNFLPSLDELEQKANVDIDFTQYRRFIYVFNCPQIGGYTFGEGDYLTLDGIALNSASTIIGDIRYTKPKIYIHELAHNLDNRHAGFYHCPMSSFISPTRFDIGCATIEYGNAFDVLGSGPQSSIGHLVTRHKTQPGWLDSSNSITLGTPGTYTYKLTPYETPSVGPLSLTIPRSNSGTGFTVEYRQPIGFDSFMASFPKQTQGAFINFSYYMMGVPTGGGADTQSIDTTPDSILTSQPTETYDNNDGALLPGNTFTDPEYGISIRTISADATGATVTVTIPAAPCERYAPTLTATSPLNMIANPGATINYTMTVKNNDSSGCKSNKFRVTTYNYASDSTYSYATKNLGVIATPDHLSLPPGGTATVTVSVTSFSDITTGIWKLRGSVQSNSIGIAKAVIPAFTYEIPATNDTTAPSTPLNVSGQALGASLVKLEWSPSTDNNGVAGYEVIRDDLARFFTMKNTLTDTYPSPSNTNHTYSIRAYDRMNNYSAASAPITVNVPAKSDFTPPVAPGNLNAISSGRDATITWNSADDKLMGWFQAIQNVRWPDCPEQRGLLNGGNNQNFVTFNYLQTNMLCGGSFVAYDADGNPSRIYTEGNGVAYTTTLNGTGQAPTRPTKFQPITAPAGKINLSWQPSSDDKGVVSYNIYRGFGLPIYATTTTPSFTDTVATSGSYFYQIEAVDAEGNTSQRSMDVSAYASSYGSTATTLPNTVTITTPIDNQPVSGTVNITANGNNETAISSLLFYVDGAYYFPNIITSPSTLALDTTKFYNGPHEVYAMFRGSAGIYTSAVMVLNVNNGPTNTLDSSTPTNVKAVADSATKVTVTWNASTNNTGVTGYYVLRNGIIILSPLGNGTTYADTTVLPNTTYKYSIQAVGATGNTSPASAEFSVTTPVGDTFPPSNPTNLTGTAVSASQINLAWTASTDNTGVSGYDIYRGLYWSGYITKVASISSANTSYGDTNLESNRTYKYYIIARDAAGNSSQPSNIATVSTSAPPPYSTTGSFSGIVTDSRTGSPLSGVTVKITINGSSQLLTTSTNGAYTIRDIPVGTYSIGFSRKRYQTQTITATIIAGQTVTKNVALQPNSKR